MARNFVRANNADRLQTSVVPLSAYPFTMACWLRPVAVNVGYIFFMFGNSASTERAGFQMGTGGGAGEVQAFSTAAGSTVFARPSADVSGANQWNHACGVWASATSRAIYCNGGSKGTNTTSRAFPTLGASPALCIGNLYGSLTNGMDGDLAEAAIWNISLTDAEVALIGSTTRPISPLFMHPESLVFYAPILGGASPEIDLNSANTLTVTNTTQVAHVNISYPRRRVPGFKSPPPAPPYTDFWNYAVGADVQYVNKVLNY